MGRVIRTSSYQKDVIYGKRTIKIEEAVEVTNLYGVKTIIYGPCSVKLVNSKIKFLDRVIISPHQYLRIIHQDGTIDHVRGPCQRFLLPSYAKFKIRELIVLQHSEVLHRKTCYGESFVKGPLNYMPDVYDESVIVYRKGVVVASFILSDMAGMPDDMIIDPQMTAECGTPLATPASVYKVSDVFRATSKQYLKVLKSDKSVEHVQGPCERYLVPSIQDVKVMDLIILKASDELQLISLEGEKFLRGPLLYMPAITDRSGVVYSNGVKIALYSFDKVAWNVTADTHDSIKNKQLQFFKKEKNYRGSVTSLSRRVQTALSQDMTFTGDVVFPTSESCPNEEASNPQDCQLEADDESPRESRVRSISQFYL